MDQKLQIKLKLYQQTNRQTDLKHYDPHNHTNRGQAAEIPYAGHTGLLCKVCKLDSKFIPLPQTEEKETTDTLGYPYLQ